MIGARKHCKCWMSGEMSALPGNRPGTKLPSKGGNGRLVCQPLGIEDPADPSLRTHVKVAIAKIQRGTKGPKIELLAFNWPNQPTRSQPSVGSTIMRGQSRRNGWVEHD